MHLRDLMTEDMPMTYAWNGWYYPWIRDVSLGSNSMATYFVNAYLMTVIADANRIIRATANGDTDEDKAILGTAYASRASIYLDYARMYEFLPNDRLPGIAVSGQDITGLTVPIIDENTQSSPHMGYYSQPRATKAEMVAFIESDLDKAEQLVGYITDPTPLLPHLDVVYGLKARLYLWAGDYDKARTYAERAIAETKTTIMTESQMTDTRKGFNDGNLWMWCIRNFETDASTISTTINWASFMCNEYSLGYSGQEYMPAINIALYNRINVSDIRKQLFVAPEDSPLYGKQQKIDPEQQLLDYVSLKFRPANGITNSPKGAETDIPLMRVEEMYLIAAEAAAHQSPLEGLRLLRDFMSHRDAHYNFNADTEEAVVNEIILQKRIELWGEGQTFFDIKRLNMSVTRDYEGTNFSFSDRFNTNGRPAWMNFVFSSAIESKNLSLVDNNNPDPSDLYSSSYKPLSAEDARAAITSDIVLHEPLWKADVPWLPLDSLSLVAFRYDEAQTNNQDVSLNYKFEISLSPDFPALGTVSWSTSFNPYSDKNNHKSYVYNVYENVEYLRNALGISGDEHTTVYMRVKGYVNRCPEVNLVSNTINFGVMNHYPGVSSYSYMPAVEVTPVANLDLDDLIEVKNPKVCNLTRKGDGELLSNQLFVLQTDEERITLQNYLTVDEQGYYTIDEGYYNYADNNMSRRLHDYYSWNRKTYPGTTVLKAWVSGQKYKNDLYLYYHTDTISFTVTPSRQLWEEARYRWGELLSKPFTSQLNSKYSRTIGFRKARYDEIHPEEDGDIYIINKPYSDYHNLLFYVDKEGKVSVPSQWAYTEDEKRVYVEGTGTFDGALFDMQLIFAYKGGETIGTFNEVIGDEWMDLGYGTLSDSFFPLNDNPVKIKQSAKNRNMFRVNLPYREMIGSDASEYIDLTIMPKGSTLNDQELPQEIVYFPEVNSGYYYSTYSAYVYITHPSDWPKYATNVNEWIDSKVLDYQDNGLPGEIELNPMYAMKDIGAWSKFPMSIVFPGWRVRDYSVEMSDVTAEKDEQGKAYAITTLTLGTDAQDVRSCVFKDNVDYNDALETLGNSTEYRVSVEEGTIRVPFDGEQLSGNLMLFVGVFDGKGQLRGYRCNVFEFYLNGDPWQSIGQGTFTDDILSSLYGLEPVTYSVEIKENTTQPGLYRVMKPYAYGVYPYAQDFGAIDGNSYYIEIDATDPEGVFIPNIDICVLDGETYSFCSVGADNIDYYMGQGYTFEVVKEAMKNAGYLGRLTDGVITFPAFERSNGKVYQGVINNAYYGGLNGKIEIRLPSAAASSNVKRVAPAADTKKIDQAMWKTPENRVLKPLSLPALKDR